MSMSRKWRLAGATAAVIIAAGLAVGVGGSAASASVGCYGDYCSGKDPQTTGCANSSTTFATVNGDGWSLQLRWSTVCKTEWARIVVYPGWMAPGSIWARQSTGYTQSAGFGGSHFSVATAFWTRQIYSPVYCVTANANQYPGYAWNVVSTRCV
jgi:hypothetical protein